MSRAQAIQELLQEIKKEEKPTAKRLNKLKKDITVKHNIGAVPTNIELLTHAPQDELLLYKSKLLSKPVRTTSGVAPIAIMTAPFPCPQVSGKDDVAAVIAGGSVMVTVCVVVQPETSVRVTE